MEIKGRTVHLFYSLILFVLFGLGSCNLFSAFSPERESALYSSDEFTPVYFSPGEAVFAELPRDSGGAVSTAVLGDNASEVYLLFTNLNLTPSESPRQEPDSMSRTERSLYFMSSSFIPRSTASSRGYGVDNPFSDADFVYSNASGDTVGKTTTFSSDPADDHVRFWETDLTGSGTLIPTEINAQCRLIVERAVTPEKTQFLSIWVADDSYGNSPGLINDAMVEALGDAFLNPVEERIYDWVTNIFGEEWGDHPYINLIKDYDYGDNYEQIPGIEGPGTDYITILLYDIDSDGIPQSGEGRVYGYFNAVDLVVNGDIDLAPHSNYSSERVMFYLDAPLFAQEDPNDDDSVWSIEDSRPSSIVSTLAHEFQHMISFYQKQVENRFDFPVETWMNEMMSLVTEDLLSSRMNVTGPRGVDPSDGTAGSSELQNGRLPAYVFMPQDSLTHWGSTTAERLQSYSTAYSYGAYLARNFGGAEFFRYLMEASSGDYRAVEEALDRIEEAHPDLYQGASELQFVDTVIRWGVANLISDTVSPIRYATLNTGGWTGDALGYQLGAINMYNYRQRNFVENTSGELGLQIYTGSGPLPDLLGSYGHLYYYMGSGLSGNLDIPFNLPSGISVTLIRR